MLHTTAGHPARFSTLSASSQLRALFAIGGIVAGTATCTSSRDSSVTGCRVNCIVARPYITPSGQRSVQWVTASPQGAFAFAAGHVYRTEDAGTSWHALDNLRFDGSVAPMIAVGPMIIIDTAVSDPDSESPAAAGAIASENGGRTWSVMPAPPNNTISVGSVLLASTGNVVIRSIDFGRSWRDTVLHFLDSTANADTFEPHGLRALSDRVVLLHTHDIDYVSRDAGVHWSRVPPPHLAYLNGVAAHGDTVYMLDTRAELHPVLLRLSDNARWIPIKTFDRKEGGDTYSLRIIGDVFWVLLGYSDQTLRASDPSHGWATVRLPPGVEDIASFVPVRDRLLAFGDHGVYRSDNAGVSWNESNGGIPDSLLDGVSSGSALVVYSQRRAYHRVASAAGWELIKPVADSIISDSAERDGDERAIFGGAASVSSVYIIAGASALRSDDGGPFIGTASLRSLLDVPGEKIPVNTPMASLGKTVLASIMRAAHSDGTFFSSLLRSTDGGARWETVADNESEDAPQFDVLTAYGGLLYAGGANGVLQSTDGLHWTTVADGLGRGLPKPTAIFASARGPVVGTAAGGIFMIGTRNARAVWIRCVATGLKGDVSGLWEDPQHANLVVAGTGFGVFWSLDRCATFQQAAFASGAPANSPVTTLVQYGDTLLALTSQGIIRLENRPRASTVRPTP